MITQQTYNDTFKNVSLLITRAGLSIKINKKLKQLVKNK